MGKNTGFLDYQRAEPQKIKPEERVQHFNEFIQPFDETTLNQQAARCMNCGIPFCHHGCPLGNVIPEFNDAVYQGQWEDAFQILRSTNNFPEFTGRICPAPCESACVLGINKPPVAIEEIEKHIAEIAYSKGFITAKPPHKRSGKKVAIIGSGPAGLAAADQLNKVGHAVTVFERDAYVGGLLRYGIPDFKLEKNVIERRVEIMREEGVQFECHAEVGKNVDINILVKDFDAIVLAIGSTIPRDLNLPGRDLKGVEFAMDYLIQSNKKVSNESFSAPEISAKGKNVVVIGAGDTASDCIGTANRQQALHIHQLQYMPTPPKERTEHMPWPEVPVLLKDSSSHEEGCHRHWAVNTKRFIGDENQQLIAVETVEVSWEYDQKGRRIKYEEVAGTVKQIPCDLALLAVGFAHPQYEGLLSQLEITTDSRGNIKASEEDFRTGIPKIFTAGDARRGQSLVVWAISEGRECARNVDKFLMGSSKLSSKDAFPYAE